MDCRVPVANVRSIPIFKLATFAFALVLVMSRASAAEPNPGSNACGANDLIMASSFEPPADYQLSFTGSSSNLITSPGQQIELAVEYLGPNGQPANASNLEWCLEDGTLLEIDPTGTSATVTSTGFAVTSVDVLVRDPMTNASTRGMVVMADLNPDAVIIEDDWVLSGTTPPEGSTSIIRLPRNGTTEAYTIGTIIASGPGAGILVRVVGITLYADYIDFEVESAALPDLFENLDINTQTSALAYRVEVDGDGVGEVSQLDAEGNKTKSLDFSNLKCNLSGLELKASTPRVSFDIKTDADFTFKISGFSVDELGLVIETTERASLNWGGVVIEVAPAFGCEVPFITIPTPIQLPIGPLVLGVGAEPKVGFELKATAPSLSITELQLPSVSGYRRSRSGFMIDASGFSTISEGEPTFQLDKGLAPKDEADISVEFKPFVGLDAKLTLNNYGLVRLLQFELGVPYTLNWNGPLDVSHRDYVGPSWKLDLLGEVKWGLDEGELNSFLRPFRGFSVAPVKFSTATPLWTRSLNLLESPNLTMALTCDPSSCYLDPENLDFATYEMATGDAYWFIDQGSVDLVGWRDGAQKSELLINDDLFVAGKSSEIWTPQSNQQGEWELAGLLEIDPVSSWRPYAVRPVKTVTVGPTFRLRAQKLDATNSQIAGGLIRTLVDELNCGETCFYDFPVNSDVTLQAKAADGWFFKNWHPNSDVCANSTSEQCLVRSAGPDITAIAVFDRLSDQAIRDHFIGEWGISGDFWVYSDGPYADEERGCADRLDNVSVDGKVVDIYVTRIFPVSNTIFYANGTVAETPNEFVCPNVTGPGERTYNGTWSVSNGVLTYNSGGSFFTGKVSELKDSYIEYEFFWAEDPQYGYRMRVVRLENP